MGTTKRERQKQARQARIEAARIAQQQANRRKKIRFYIGFAVAIVVLVFLGSLLIGGDDDNGGEAAGSTSTTLGTPVSITVPPTARFVSDPVTPCPAADGSTERATSFAAAPPMCIDPAKTYTATVDTTEGEFTIELDAVNAPVTANNFVVLSRYHYYDGVAFHRILPGFVIQGGDAKGPQPGTGDAGYKIPDELPKSGPPFYAVGDLAMANSGANTSGTQFFIITGDDGANLPANYSKFGKIGEGMDVVMEIEKAGQADGSQEGVIVKEVKINSVTITES